MRTAYPSATLSVRATLPIFVALIVGTIALMSIGTRPAESQQAPAQPPYEVHDLGTLGGSYGFSYAYGINDSGEVVGTSVADTPEGLEFHAFLYSDGVMKDLGTLPGGHNSIAYDINDAGKVVGTSDVDA